MDKKKLKNWSKNVLMEGGGSFKDFLVMEWKSRQLEDSNQR